MLPGDRARSKRHLCPCHTWSLWSAGPWLELCEELQSLRLAMARTQNKEDPRCCLQKSSLPAAACTGLWRCYCSPPIGAGPLTLEPYGSTPVPPAASEAQIRAPAAVFTKAEAAAAAGEAALETATTWGRVLGWPGDALPHYLSPDQRPFLGRTSPSKVPAKPTAALSLRLGSDAGKHSQRSPVSVGAFCSCPLLAAFRDVPPGESRHIAEASLPEDAGTAAP